jgi:hypothetical protein
MTAWNDFVKRIYHEGKKNNKNYSFKQALTDASKRKGEMGSMTKSSKKSSKGKKGGAVYGSSLNAASLPLSPEYDGIDGQGITQGMGQSGPLTAALTASGGGKRRRTKSKRSTKKRSRKSGRKTRRNR